MTRYVGFASATIVAELAGAQATTPSAQNRQTNGKKTTAIEEMLLCHS